MSASPHKPPCPGVGAALPRSAQEWVAHVGDLVGWQWSATPSGLTRHGGRVCDSRLPPPPHRPTLPGLPISFHAAPGFRSPSSRRAECLGYHWPDDPTCPLVPVFLCLSNASVLTGRWPRPVPGLLCLHSYSTRPLSPLGPYPAISPCMIVHYVLRSPILLGLPSPSPIESIMKSRGRSVVR